MKKIYLIGSLRNDNIPRIAGILRDKGFEVFDDWYSPGPETDEFWKEYESLRGRNFLEALRGHHAQQVFEFDKKHLDNADIAIMVLPCGRSGHLELGYTIGLGKPGYILLDIPEPDRYDIMYQFATGVYGELETLISEIEEK